MNNTSALLGYVIAVLEMAFAGVGFVTGWITPNEALTLFTVGLGVFGIHNQNVAVGKAVGAVRGY